MNLYEFHMLELRKKKSKDDAHSLRRNLCCCEKKNEKFSLLNFNKL